ncbi:gamma-glutamylcyclotransferase family protein [Aureimonas ureilytica]|uniref:gamma-glutamylcyclotransferase family protein n=1 Tax=Aureimonas ureilytica TaxID=401562 RepID=UPI00037F0A66|nr:gamma-glutamylcyclotransferase family protein [Aureimonas ureilytica]
MMDVFVYGTLKQGFPFHPLGLSGARFLGPVETLEPYPMVIAGSFYGPMMLERPGEGLRVRGELYRVEPERLAKLDELEDVGKPGSYRTRIAVGGQGADRVEAIGYMKSAEWLKPVHTGYLSDYQDRRFIPPWER